MYNFMYVYAMYIYMYVCKSVSMYVCTVYTRVQVERVYKSNPIFEAKKYNFFRKSLIF